MRATRIVAWVLFALAILAAFGAVSSAPWDTPVKLAADSGILFVAAALVATMSI